MLVFASMAFAFAFATAASASAAAPLDTVTATGAGTNIVPTGGGGDISNLEVSAQSGTSGDNPSGTVSFTDQVLFGANTLFDINLGGQVTCLSITGPDRGAGTPSAPTTAVLNFDDTVFGFGITTVQLVDNGGNGADTFSLAFGRAANDCSPVSTPQLTDVLTSGRAVVYDAPLVPATIAQCTNGGWMSYPQFKSEWNCLAFVVQAARSACIAERAQIGRAAFRDKYGDGPNHRHALRRCVEIQVGQ